MEQVVAAIQAGDYGAYLACHHPQTVRQMEGNAQRYIEEFQVVTDLYQGELLSWKRLFRFGNPNISARPNSAVSTCFYRLETDQGAYIVTVGRIEKGGQSGLPSIQLMADWTALGETPVIWLWLFRLLNLVVRGFILFSLLHCLGSELRGKVSLALLILLQMGLSLVVAWKQSGNSVSPMVLRFYEIRFFAQGGFALVICLPVDTIVY